MKKMAGTLKVQRRKLVAPRMAPAAARRADVQPTRSGSHIVLGRIVAWDGRGPTVDFEGNSRGPVRARLTSALPGQLRPVSGVAAPEVVLLVDPGAARPPIILGFLTPLDGAAKASTPAAGTPGPLGSLDARVDGKRVEIEGQDEIVLRCGKASIVLRRNGRVVIRGVDVETKAAGVNRVKGGSVLIN